MAAFIPKRGDIVRLTLDPPSGSAQEEKRCVLVLSPAPYNAATGLMLCCPVTSEIKGYPFEVALDDGKDGAALADQVKSLDWRARKARKKGAASKAELALTLARIKPLLGF